MNPRVVGVGPSSTAQLSGVPVPVPLLQPIIPSANKPLPSSTYRLGGEDQASTVFQVTRPSAGLEAGRPNHPSHPSHPSPPSSIRAGDRLYNRFLRNVRLTVAMENRGYCSQDDRDQRGPAYGGPDANSSTDWFSGKVSNDCELQTQYFPETSGIMSSASFQYDSDLHSSEEDNVFRGSETVLEDWLKVPPINSQCAIGGSKVNSFARILQEICNKNEQHCIDSFLGADNKEQCMSPAAGFGDLVCGDNNDTQGCCGSAMHEPSQSNVDKNKSETFSAESAPLMSSWDSDCGIRHHFQTRHGYTEVVGVIFLILQVIRLFLKAPLPFL